MNVAFTEHMIARMAEREITEAQVTQVVLHPEQVVYFEDEPPVAQSRIELGGKKCLLRILFRDDGETRIAITVYITSQIRRYWKVEQESQDESNL
jgi:hypothetical protein